MLFKKEKGTGALNDPRSSAEKMKDYQFVELVANPQAVNWYEKTEAEWRKFPIYDQNGSGSCVAQTAAKLLGVSYWLKNKQYVHFSATDIYQQRFNKPSAGMASFDVFNIIKNNGATLEELAPSQNLTDVQMDGTEIPAYKREVGRVFKVSNYLEAPSGDIETIASIIQATGKAVMVWFYFTRDEWTSVPKILDENLTLVSNNALRHSVTAVDFTMYLGEKALIIEDSWGVKYGKGGRRVITESFFKKRNYFAGYLMNFNFEGTAPKPVMPAGFEGCEYGDSNNSVKFVQDAMRHEGFFPLNVESTGYYGSVTAKAVYQFQTKYAVAPQYELDAYQGRVVGPKTVSKLKELFG